MSRDNSPVRREDVSSTRGTAQLQHTRTMRVPRTRGAISGLLLLILGAWGALVPFIGPYFDYSVGTDRTWVWTSARFWLEVLPGGVTALGGLLVLVSANRVVGSFGGWLAAAGGAWFVIGRTLAPPWHLGDPGAPLSTRPGGRAAADLGYFYGLGALIILLAAFALGRLAVVGVRDVRAAERQDESARQLQAEREAEIRARSERPAMREPVVGTGGERRAETVDPVVQGGPAHGVTAADSQPAEGRAAYPPAVPERRGVVDPEGRG